MNSERNEAVSRPITRSLAFRQTLQKLVAREAEGLSQSGNATDSGIVGLPEPSVYKPYRAAFGSLGGLFLTSGPASVQLKDEISAAGSASDFTSMARAANAFIHSQAAAPGAADDLGFSESEDTDASLADPLDEVRDTASRAFSVANNALTSCKPAIAIVFDPESGIPVLVNVSKEWARACTVPLEEGRRSICDNGVFPPAMHFMDRKSAIQMSAAMGSAESANELVPKDAHPLDVYDKKTSSNLSGGGVASTASIPQQQSNSTALDTSVNAESESHAKHPASKFIVQLMHAMVNHANAGSSSAKMVSQQFLPVANGLPLPAHMTVEFINVNRKHAGRYTICMATANTAPLADPLAQAMPVLGMRAMLQRAAAGSSSQMDALSSMFANFVPPGQYTAIAAAQYGSVQQQRQRHPVLDAFKRQAASGSVLGTQNVTKTPGRGLKRSRGEDAHSDDDSDLVGNASEVDSELNTAGAVAALFPLDWPGARLQAARTAHGNLLAAAADRQGMVGVDRGVQGASKRSRIAGAQDTGAPTGTATTSRPGDAAVSSALAALMGEV